MSQFHSLNLLPADPIMNLPILFAADPHPRKVNLGIGTYKDEQGKSQVLEAVRKAEELITFQKLNKEYPPIEGNQSFISALLPLIFGETLLHKISDRLFAQQTVGGTNALRVAGEFISRNLTPQIFVSDPTWANHPQIFHYAHLQVSEYPYYNSIEHGIDFLAVCESVGKMARGSVILLHACCHNPTGTDFTHDQWKVLSQLLKKQGVIPLFDLAYQGFGKGVEEDVYAVRLFAEEGHEMFVASSYAKNFGLYGERVGMLVTITENQETMEKARSHLKQIARSNYSVPPLQGGRIVATILQDPDLKQLWHSELNTMRERIQTMRLELVSGLEKAKISQDFGFMKEQLGMFSYTDLTVDQVKQLRSEFGIYLAGTGRANIAGLNRSNLSYVIDAFTQVLK